MKEGDNILLRSFFAKKDEEIEFKLEKKEVKLNWMKKKIADFKTRNKAALDEERLVPHFSSKTIKYIKKHKGENEDLDYEHLKYTFFHSIKEDNRDQVAQQFIYLKKFITLNAKKLLIESKLQGMTLQKPDLNSIDKQSPRKDYNHLTNREVMNGVKNLWEGAKKHESMLIVNKRHEKLHKLVEQIEETKDYEDMLAIIKVNLTREMQFGEDSYSKNILN